MKRLLGLLDTHCIEYENRFTQSPLHRGLRTWRLTWMVLVIKLWAEYTFWRAIMSNLLLFIMIITFLIYICAHARTLVYSTKISSPFLTRQQRFWLLYKETSLLQISWNSKYQTSFGYIVVIKTYALYSMMKTSHLSLFPNIGHARIPLNIFSATPKQLIASNAKTKLK